MKLKEKIYSFFDRFRKPDEKEVEGIIKLFGLQEEESAYLVKDLCSIVSKKDAYKLISGLGTIYNVVYKKASEALAKKNEKINDLESEIENKDKKISNLENKLSETPKKLVSGIINSKIFKFNPEFYKILECLNKNESKWYNIQEQTKIKKKELTVMLNKLEYAKLIEKNQDSQDSYLITKIGVQALNLGCIEEEKQDEISTTVGGDKNYALRFERWLNNNRGTDHTTRLLKICKESSCLEEVGQKFFKDRYTEDRTTQEQHIKIKIADYELAAKITLEKFNIDYKKLFIKNNSKDKQ